MLRREGSDEAQGFLLGYPQAVSATGPRASIDKPVAPPLPRDARSDAA